MMEKIKSFYQQAHQAAFTFVEMAVVISVMGLIVAAVLVGQQLAETARVKAMVSEVQTLKTAVGQFQAMYNGLPGDVADATDFWSGTVDGNSDGEIAAETSNEAFRALEQLTLAGYMDGNYSGVWGSAFDRGGNVIASKLERGSMMYIQCCGGEDDSTLEFINQVVVFTSANNDTERAGAVTPEEAFAIDSKLDDGNPDMGEIGANGNMVAGTYQKIGCYSGAGSGASYLVTLEETGCQMYFGYNWE